MQPASVRREIRPGSAPRARTFIIAVSRSWLLTAAALALLCTASARAASEELGNGFFHPDTAGKMHDLANVMVPEIV